MTNLLARWAQLRAFARFYRQAQTIYQVHSPMAYGLAEKLLRGYEPAVDGIEALRRQLLQDDRLLTVTDHGAGSQSIPGDRRTVAQICRMHAGGRRQGRRLYKIAELYRPQTVLELGTSLGLSAAYLATGAKPGQMVTIEGCPQTAMVARENLQQLGLEQVEVLTGPFTEKLPEALEKLSTVDLVYLDGHHRYRPTLEYFEACLPRVHAQTVFLLDDLYWSAEMADAWAAIKRHPEVKLTVDLFFLGIVYFDPGIRKKQHFQLVPTAWKPWRKYVL